MMLTTMPKPAPASAPATPAATVAEPAHQTAVELRAEAAELQVNTRRRRRWWAWQQKYAPYLFVSPFVILFCIFLLYPLGRSIVLSLYQTAGPTRRKYVGFENYSFLLRDKYFWLAFANTAVLAIGFLVLQIPLSLGLAMLLNSKRVRGRSFFRFAFFSTHLVGAVFVGVLFFQLFNVRSGLINRTISAIAGRELHIPWLLDPYLARASIIIAWLWLTVGYGMIYFLAALQAVDTELYEAADVDGAGRWHRFWHVTIPGIRPVLVFMIVVGTIAAFQLFELPYVLFPGTGSFGPDNSALTIVMYLFNAGFLIGDLGLASATGWILVILILVISLIQLRASGAIGKKE
jgi:ABC-type sugar transport system permease subunit